MKKLILLFTLIFWGVFQSQEKFELTREKGLSEFVITQIPGKSASEIYIKVNEWLQKNYKNPDYVLKGTVVDDYVRFEGVSNEVIAQNPDNKLIFLTLGKLKYEIEIYVKDARYKFSVISLQHYVSTFGWGALDQTGNIYNKKGELKGAYKQLVNLPPFFNGLNNSLKDYIMNSSISKSENW